MKLMEALKFSSVSPIRYSHPRLPSIPHSLPFSSSTFFPLHSKSMDSVSLPNRSISNELNRNFSVLSSSGSGDGVSSIQEGESFFRDVLSRMESVYLDRNPTAKAVLKLVRSTDNDRICYDHIAFRTFGVNGYGIGSMANFFKDFGYTQRDELRFPAKKLKAYWFSPPESSTGDSGGGGGVYGPLPRIFISELLVDQMSLQAQEIIGKYTKNPVVGNKHGVLASAIGSLTWEKPSHSEFKLLARESEYAAWTLVNGYAVNHVTISTHRLSSGLREIANLNKFVEDNGFKLNSEGGILKVSPDGLLLQSSTVADSITVQFSDGVEETVPCSYIEFAERLILPQYRNIPAIKVGEFHRRDGFEVGNADKIFESTSMDQLTRKK
ncbi:uncharacterized protein LOC124933979 [Impatiens glandulifera]|uniref:uncharacterized protein LOC124933979 n=1 Tax=Impatiens glandulifera TaxID=253017 RepID=UPI001FB14B27|nr:uncharacterized protein LOC124933979 [Impatiens glandulifera]